MTSLLTYRSSDTAQRTVLLYSMERVSACKLLRNDLLSLVVPYLDIATAARLMCASRRSMKELQQVLIVPCLLIYTAEQAAIKHVLMRIPGPTLSLWLERFPVPNINKYSDALLQIPNFPLPLAAALVGGGLSISYQHFLSVVHAAVPGLQVWLQAYKQLNLPPPEGVHPLAVGLCCDEYMQLMIQEPQVITPADLRDLLHIAIAMPRNSNATDNLSLLCERPEAQGLEGDAWFKLLQAAVKVCASERVALLLAHLPAAKQLSQDSIAALLHAAVRASLSRAVRLLCNLPAAQAVTEATVGSLLQAAVLSKGLRIVKTICQLPAAQGLTTSQIAGSLHAAVKDDQRLAILLRLPAARAIPAATVAALMAKALAAAEVVSCHEKVAALCALDGAQGIDSSTLQELLQTAVQKLPAARAFPLKVADSRDRVLSAAAKVGPCHRKIVALCGLAGAREIDSNTLQDMLQTAVQLQPEEQQATIWKCLLMHLEDISHS